MKKYAESFVIGDDSDEPQAITLPNPPPDAEIPTTSCKPLHRPDREATGETKESGDKS